MRKEFTEMIGLNLIKLIECIFQITKKQRAIFGMHSVFGFTKYARMCISFTFTFVFFFFCFLHACMCAWVWVHMRMGLFF